jgi:hypothetical protein
MQCPDCHRHNGGHRKDFKRDYHQYKDQPVVSPLCAVANMPELANNLLPMKMCRWSLYHLGKHDEQWPVPNDDRVPSWL